MKNLRNKKYFKPCKRFHLKGVCEYAEHCFFQHDSLIIKDKKDFENSIPNPRWILFKQHESEGDLAYK